MTPDRREPHPDDLMTTGEAARLLGLSPDMVRILERDGRLPARRTTNGVRLFRRGDVDLLVAARSQAPNNEEPSPARPGKRVRTPRNGTEGDK